MRFAFAPVAALPLALTLATVASAQTLDRYGGGAALPTPAYAPQPPQAAPVGYAPVSGYAPAPYAAMPAGYGAPVYPSMAAYGGAPATARQPTYRQGAPRAITAPSMTSAGMRTLSWPGKEPASAQPQTAALQSPPAMAGYRPAPQPYAMAPPRYAPTAMPQPAPYPPTSYAQTPYAPALQTQPQPAPRYAFATPPAAVRPAPTSIYSDPPAPAAQTSAAQPAALQGYAPPMATAPQPYATQPHAPQGYAAPTYAPQAYAYAPAAAGAPQLPAAPMPAAVSGGSRQYSLHKEYGLTPDPAPIPPQFFANTADLSAPETPDVVAPPRVTGSASSTKAAENAARLAASAVQ